MTKVMTNGDLARTFHTRAAALADGYKTSAPQRLEWDAHMHGLGVRGQPGDPAPDSAQIAAIVDGFMTTLDGVAVLSIPPLLRVLVDRARAYAATAVATLGAGALAAAPPTQSQVDAVLVGVVNHIAAEHCVDLALYARDISPAQEAA